jgi:hypothetical protein
MASKKQSLPEVNVDAGQIVDEARAAVEARSKVAEFTTIEKQHTEAISKLAVEKRVEEAGRDNYIGIVRVTGQDLPPVRVEMRMENGALDVSEDSNLDAIYGSTRPLLFQREKVVNEIIDPMALIQELVDAGKNPFDYVDLKVRTGMDHILVESKHVTSGEAVLPKEGFLNTVNEIKNTLSPDAKEYTKAYLENALKPRVVLGTKGKA